MFEGFWDSPIVNFLAAFLGWVGGLLTTQFKWNTERQKLIHQSRENRVKELRKQIDELNTATNAFSHAMWVDLEPYMPEDDKVRFKSSFVVAVSPGAVRRDPDSIRKQILFRALAELEKKWEVV